MGEAEVDQNPEWLLEFWNRSLSRFSSLDGSVLGPGYSGSPNILRNGALYWQNNPEGLKIQYAYGVEDLPCVDLAGSRVRTHQYRARRPAADVALVQLAKPNRLQSTCTGIYADGWTRAERQLLLPLLGPRPAGCASRIRARENYPIKPSPVHIVARPAEDRRPAAGPRRAC